MNGIRLPIILAIPRHFPVSIATRPLQTWQSTLRRRQHPVAYPSEQRVTVFQPPVRGSGPAACFTFPEDVFFNGHVDIIYFLNPIRLSCSSSESKEKMYVQCLFHLFTSHAIKGQTLASNKIPFPDVVQIARLHRSSKAAFGRHPTLCPSLNAAAVAYLASLFISKGKRKKARVSRMGKLPVSPTGSCPSFFPLCGRTTPHCPTVGGWTHLFPATHSSQVTLQLEVTT